MGADLMRRLAATLFAAGLCAPALAQQVSDPVSSTAPATIKKVTPSIAADTAMLTTANTTSFTAGQILDGAFLIPPGSGAKTLDGTRGLVFAPTDTTVNLVSGLAAYVVSDAVTAVGGFPATVGLFAAGVARGNNAKVWGINTLLSDTLTGAVSAGTGKSLNNELDFNVSSPSTTVLGLQFAGGSKAQPAYAHAVILQPLDSPNNGTVAKWTDFLSSTGGSTVVFADIGTKERAGTAIHSQDVVFNFLDSTGTPGRVAIAGSEAGGLELFSTAASARALSIVGGAGRIDMPDGSGIRINGRVVAAASGAAYSVGSDAGHSVQNYSNASAATTILGASIKLSTLPASAGAGGMYVCIDSAGQLYKKASCP